MASILHKYSLDEGNGGKQCNYSPHLAWKTARYRIKLVFLRNEHRLRGTVEQEVDESELLFSILRQLLDGMVPTILNHHL